MAITLGVTRIDVGGLEIEITQGSCVFNPGGSSATATASNIGNALVQRKPFLSKLGFEVPFQQGHDMEQLLAVVNQVVTVYCDTGHVYQVGGMTAVDQENSDVSTDSGSYPLMLMGPPAQKLRG